MQETVILNLLRRSGWTAPVSTSMKTRWGAGAVSTSMKTRKTDQRWCHYCSRGLFWEIASLQINYNYQVPGSLPNEDDKDNGAMGLYPGLHHMLILARSCYCESQSQLGLVELHSQIVFRYIVGSKMYFENKGKLYFEATAMLVCRLPIEGRGSKLRCRQNILYFLQNPSKSCDFVKSKSIVPCPPSPLP